MSAGRRVYCAWCGADLGAATSCFRQMESCGAPDCEREVRGMERAEQEEAQLRAEADGFGAYR